MYLEPWQLYCLIKSEKNIKAGVLSEINVFTRFRERIIFFPFLMLFAYVYNPSHVGSL